MIDRTSPQPQNLVFGHTGPRDGVCLKFAQIPCAAPLRLSAPCQRQRHPVTRFSLTWADSASLRISYALRHADEICNPRYTVIWVPIACLQYRVAQPSCSNMPDRRFIDEDAESSNSRYSRDGRAFVIDSSLVNTRPCAHNFICLYSAARRQSCPLYSPKLHSALLSLVVSSIFSTQEMKSISALIQLAACIERPRQNPR
jgi:hypothetical protein